MYNGTLSSDPVIAAAEIREVAEHIIITRYMILVGFVVLIYDHLLTLVEEVEFVWRRPKNLISWIFLGNRYLTPVVLAIDIYDKLGGAKGLSVPVIVTWVIGEIVFHFGSHASVHGLVVIRVNALWGNRPAIRWFLYGSWFAYFVTTLSIALAAAIQKIETFHPDPVINICFSIVGHFVLWVWVPPIMLECILFGFTVAKAFNQNRRAISSTPIAYVLYRDGALYFIVITLCSIFNLIVWRWLPLSYFALAKYFSLGLVNAMASRMILNLRSLGGVRNDDTPPTVYFVEAVPSQVCKDGELTFDARCITSETREIRFQHPYANFNRIASPSRKDRALPSLPDHHSAQYSHKKKQTGPHNDPYFYNRQANQLRALKVRRPEFNFKVTPTLPEPAFAHTGSFMGTAEIEETAARVAISPTPGGRRSKRSSLKSSKLGPPTGDTYSMETWSVKTVPLSQAQTRDVEVQSNVSSDSAASRGESKPQRGAGLADRQNEALQEFESLKRKYLQYNKQIIKENSNLRVQVEEMKAQISQLYVENLALGRSNIALEKELKREKARRTSGGDPKTINQTDKLAADMIKQLETLRQSFAKMTQPPPEPKKEPTPEPVIRSRPSVSNRINLISRAPEFENIEEGEELDEDEYDRCLEPSLVPLPDDDDDLSPRTSHPLSSSSSPEMQVEVQPAAPKRKPTRRQSGLLGPSRARISLSPDDEEEVAGMLADREEETTSVVPAALKARRKAKNTEGNPRPGLCDVTNSPPRRENIQKGIMSVLDEAEDDLKVGLKAIQPPAQRTERSKPKSAGAPPSSKSVTPDPSTAPSLPTSIASADGHADSAEEASASARPTRARKSVNYAEPKLNTKMRKPDEPAPIPYGYPSLPSAGGSLSKSSKAAVTPVATTSSTPAPVDRPIKPLPSSSSKVPTAPSQQKPTSGRKSLDSDSDDPLPQPQSRPKAKAGQSESFARPPSVSPVPRSDLSSDEEESEEEPTEEEDMDVTPKKKRPAFKVVDEFKCASLSSTAPTTKPSRIAAPVATSSTHERPFTTSSLPRPTSQQPSTLGFQRTNPAPSAASSFAGDAASKKRKTAPVKYQYFDFDSDEDEGVVEGDSEYVPPERIKPPAPKKSTAQAASGTARRHSSTS
ncbi:hypothetical protein FRC01_005193 [Tulasnella sp. 417]|nr:hypothetical protein FRC01_005193 [Tulasnella sp. 417]